MRRIDEILGKGAAERNTSQERQRELLAAGPVLLPRPAKSVLNAIAEVEKPLGNLSVAFDALVNTLANAVEVYDRSLEANATQRRNFAMAAREAKERLLVGSRERFALGAPAFVGPEREAYDEELRRLVEAEAFLSPLPKTSAEASVRAIFARALPQLREALNLARGALREISEGVNGYEAKHVAFETERKARAERELQAKADREVLDVKAALRVPAELRAKLKRAEELGILEADDAKPAA